MYNSTKDIWVKSFDNIHLKCVSDPIEDSKAVVLIIHGLAEHYKRYDYVSNKLNSYGFSVYRYDHRGHGDSDGKRGYVDDVDTFTKDLKTIIDLIKNENPTSPLFILGQGMGGHLMLRLGAEYSNLANGMIFCSPLVCDFSNYTICDEDGYDSEFDFVSVANVHNLSHDYEFIQSYEDDELVLKQVTVGIYNALKESTSNIKSSLHDFKYPCLIFHGSMDSITDCEDSRFLFNNILSNDKELKILNGLYHKLLDELIKDDIINEISKWIEERC
ncbi:MAG: alpha/beta hydrolase [Terrisporobacter sp.]|uniref:alpha/beta hydrolase n=1 Tax=Terrisporobacter sp. TaxID=1965305 RepID=UPI002FCA45CF